MNPLARFLQFDLITPDGKLVKKDASSTRIADCEILIEKIPDFFVGFYLEKELLSFNLKSTLAQLGLTTYGEEIELSLQKRRAYVHVKLQALDRIGEMLLQHLKVGAFIGKIFAKDKRRLVRDPFYLSRLFGRNDRYGLPLLTLGGSVGDEGLHLEKRDDRTVAFLPLRDGCIIYSPDVEGFLPTLEKSLHDEQIRTRHLIRINQFWKEEDEKSLKNHPFLLVATETLHMRTVFAHVVDELLPKGYQHTSASILQPDAFASGDIYELFGESDEKLERIPLEFYTLHPYREHVFFEDRDQLQASLEEPESLFKAMQTAPGNQKEKVATFVVKGSQLLNLNLTDWVLQSPNALSSEDITTPDFQQDLVERYLREQPSYHFLSAIEEGFITSEGILLTRHLPSPFMKRMFLSSHVIRSLKGLYFQYASKTHGQFFTHEDRSLIYDLSKFGIPIFWLDETHHQALQYVPKPNKDSGMFVPVNRADEFMHATTIGVYGSNLIEGDFEGELFQLIEGLKGLRETMNHPLLNKKTPLALVTGGGPGVMLVANRCAKKTGILSCANIVDFKKIDERGVHEQDLNPYIDAKMTYRLDRLVERQAEFHLDLPIFLHGGIGTDFEFALEEVRRKVGVIAPTPILLFGTHSYWGNKITGMYQQNIEKGTIQGSEWISNCFYCVHHALEALEIYRMFFAGRLPIGPKGPIYKEGFVEAKHIINHG